MGMLVAGILIWCLVHLTPSLAPPLKQNLITRLGEKGYKLLFTALMLTALALIVFGWRSATPSHLYQLPGFTRHIAMLLVLIAFILFGASNYPTRIKQFIRHPQLTGVIVWAIAHLVLNGDSRSVLLFGSLGMWAALEIIFINKREGEWVKQPVPGWAREIRGLAISLVVFAVVVMLHPYLTGVSITGF
jgi:uncharacterized membrane protein